MGKTEEIKTVLSGCQRIELAMAAFYDQLATLHANTAPAAARVWRKTANEERNHAAQFTLAIAGVGERVQSVRVDMRAIDMASEAVNHLIEECANHVPSVEQAARAALEFESALIGIHLDKVAEFSDPKHKDLFRAMMAADRDHVEEIGALIGMRFPPKDATPAPSSVGVRTNRK